MVQNQYTVYLDAALLIAKEAGQVLLEFLGQLKDIREKSAAGDLVTEADHASEKVILTALRDQFPGHAILSEESGLHDVKGADFVWSVDPLDGTTNYTHEIPFFAVSIGLLYRGEPIMGVVYNPFLSETFCAVKGGGATRNGNKIHVSKVGSLNKAVLATGFAYDRRDTPDNNYAEFCCLTAQTQGVRRMGSAALDLAYVAMGRFDGFWERGLKPWDISAGIVIVREAGGVVSSYENGPLILDSGRILASNGLIHSTLSKHLLKVPEDHEPIIF
jgi:myo-inositol-1(or 4)-monophosphatase